jgi:hypothetical protein
MPEITQEFASPREEEAAKRIVEADDRYNSTPRLKRAWAWDVYKEEAVVCGATVARAYLALLAKAALLAEAREVVAEYLRDYGTNEDSDSRQMADRARAFLSKLE